MRINCISRLNSILLLLLKNFTRVLARFFYLATFTSRGEKKELARGRTKTYLSSKTFFFSLSLSALGPSYIYALCPPFFLFFSSVRWPMMSSRCSGRACTHAREEGKKDARMENRRASRVHNKRQT